MPSDTPDATAQAIAGRLRKERDEAIAVLEYAAHIHDTRGPKRAGVFIAAYVAETPWAVTDFRVWQSRAALGAERDGEAAPATVAPERQP